MDDAVKAAKAAARAWIEGYGIRTEPYTRSGGDHPMMDTLPAAFLAFAAALSPATGRAEGEEAPNISAVVEAKYAEMDAERIGRLERELGVKGIGAVFRESLRLAKETRAEASKSDRDDVVSARLTAWKDGHGGVDLTFASGRRVALALDAPHLPAEDL